MFEQNNLLVTLAFGVGTRLLGGRGVAVMRLQERRVMMMMPPTVPFAAGGVVPCLSPPLSLCQQTGSLPSGKASQLLPVLTVQLKWRGNTDNHNYTKSTKKSCVSWALRIA